MANCLGKVTGDNQVKPALLSGEETKTGGMKLQMFSIPRMFYQRDLRMAKGLGKYKQKRKI